MQNNNVEVKLSQRCPHCNGELMQLSYLDPINFDYQTKTKIICTNCHKELQRSDLKVTEPIEQINEQSTEMPNGAMMGWICPKCGRALSPYTNECPCSIKYEFTCSSKDNSSLSQYLGYSRKDKLGYE